MVDPTSDLGEDVTEENAPTCTSCGERIVNRPTHRVRSWIEEGEVEHRHFCDDSCLAEFEGV